MLPQERYVLSESFVIVRRFLQKLQTHKINMIKREKLARHTRTIWRIWACDVTPRRNADFETWPRGTMSNKGTINVSVWVCQERPSPTFYIIGEIRRRTQGRCVGIQYFNWPSLIIAHSENVMFLTFRLRYSRTTDAATPSTVAASISTDSYWIK